MIWNVIITSSHYSQQIGHNRPLVWSSTVTTINWILNVDQIVPQAYCQVTLNLNATILHNIEGDNGVVDTAFKHIQPLENWTTILRNECCL